MDTSVASTPWYRIDVFRGCKTGEVIEAEPRTLAEKLREAAPWIALGMLAFAATHWFFKVWTPRYHAELDELAKVDPVASARKLAEFNLLLLFAPMLFAIVGGIFVTIRAIRLVRAGRRPLPSDRVRVRTEVVAGWWCARLPAILWGTSALACVFAAWWNYVRLVAMFWNGYLDRLAGVAH